MLNRVSLFVLTTVCILVIVAGAVQGQGAAIPGDQQAAIFSRVLAYDRNLKARAGARVTVGIVYKAAHAASEAANDELSRAFASLRQRTIQTLPLEIVSHAYTDAAHLDAWLVDNGVDALYVAPGLDAFVDGIRTTSAQRKIASLSTQRKQLQQGLTIGVVIKDGRPGIVINLGSAKSLGMDLDPKLLQLAEVIR
jgi:hypothetical protein